MATPPMEYTRVPDLHHTGLQELSTASRYSKSLYISHFISTWNSRGFEFGAVLFLATIYPGTLLPMSIYALVRALAAIVFSSAVGRHIDTTNRLAVVRLSILGQRLAVSASCAGFLCLLLLKTSLPSAVLYGIFALLVVLACVEKLCIIMNTVAVERDWVVVIAGSNEGLLQEMNAQMRRIDLFCKLIAPLAIALLHSLSSTIAIAATLVLNSTSVIAEYFLIALVYQKTPGLSSNSWWRQNSASSHADQAEGYRGQARRVLAGLKKQTKLYAGSPAFLPSVSLSMLYLTVLSFSGQMITYLFAIDNPRLTGVQIGLLRTISTVLEISATFIAPLLVARLGAVRAGIWSLSWQCICLTPGLATFWVPVARPTATQTYCFIASVVLSRVGLWSFDLTAQLLVQNTVDSSQRGSFSAIESSLQNLFELCTFAMTIVWSEPGQFRYPATVSLAAVCVAAACYAQFVRVERGHLLHMPPCCESVYGYKTLRPIEDAEELEPSIPAAHQ